jgi:hypothetical protein
MLRSSIPLAPTLLLAACGSLESVGLSVDARPERQRYVAHRAPQPLWIDGLLDEAAWVAAPPTAAFVDIQGVPLPRPRQATSAKLLWDSDYLYIGADLVEPHLWGTLTRRDSVIFHDNDFEVFLDPDGDTHDYYELEINALGTEWDLLLEKPYRDGGPALHEFDTPGLESAVALAGTLNDPSDIDQGWSVEIAIPWAALRAIAGRPVPPTDGDVWWVNFSRVQWRLDVEVSDAGEGSYVKRCDEAGKPLPEDNWVWSPQGVIAMHEPESWGLVMFAEEPVTELDPRAPREFANPADLDQRALLRAVYKAQHAFRAGNGSFSERPSQLGVGAEDLGDWTLTLHVTPSGFEAVLVWRAPGAGGASADHKLRIDERGHLW